MISDNLWDSVLQQVNSTQPIPLKHLLVLGDSLTGKSALVQHLHPKDTPAHDLALSYTYTDVKDDDNEETLARLNIYQLSSDHTSDQQLLRLVLNPSTLKDTMALVVLDWSRPWRFVKSLIRWIHVLETAAVSNQTDKMAVEDCRQKLEEYLQQSHDSPTTDTTTEVLLPLAKGVLEDNLGVPMVVVCAKADSMGAMERERAFREEDFDYTQQILRAICLRYGAGLLYTSTHTPNSFSTLYQYLAHRLVGSQFKPKPNVVDREGVVVPSGWDSIAKIGYLREPFDVEEVQKMWELDMERYRKVVAKGESADTTGKSLLRMYGETVVAPKHRAANPTKVVEMGNGDQVVVEADQVFLEHLYEELQDQMALEGEQPQKRTLPMVDGSNKLVSSLLRTANESSLSTASQQADEEELEDEGGSAKQNPSSNEELTSFFQNLLGRKPTAASSSAGSPKK